MFGNSQPVTSNQNGPHADLLKTVERHCQTRFRKPASPHTRQAFGQMLSHWHRMGQPPLVLDAGCGVGWSTLTLAQRHPDQLVIGVDQSAERLRRGPDGQAGNPDNLLLLRADLVDFWRLLAAEGCTLDYHYLLYPNPWPRKQHLGRRWHGHPVFPAIATLGGKIECRSNWLIYLEEFAAALSHLTGATAEVTQWLPKDDQVLTPFEAKYRASGHALWRYCTRLPPIRAFHRNTVAATMLP